ncbi:hypothetical protein N7457_008666 [Penicillium paradoxum]|uniref:uncharacterized protein n=1 Tax=Penicillium paradoxum TaxID=176176 RepID=UPI002548782E|nr:uncharacterized protein N7457_008666 [Penicillium paradoxum]KAJ5773770.1 hypothetical protein N7457_008666 [Penicillium paradoxum]
MVLKALLTFATLGLAQDYPVVSLFIPNADPQSLVGAVVQENSATTTYSINCPPGTNSTDCGMGPGMLLTTAATSVEYLISGGVNDVYDHVICSMTDPTSADRTCTGTVTGSSATAPSTSILTLNQDKVTALPVTITSSEAAIRTDTAVGVKGSETSLQSATPTGAKSNSAGSVCTGNTRLTTLVLACVAVQVLAASL